MLAGRPGAGSAVAGLDTESSDTRDRAPLSPRLTGGRHRPGAYLYPSLPAVVAGVACWKRGPSFFFLVRFPLPLTQGDRNLPVILLQIFALILSLLPLDRKLYHCIPL